MNILLGFVLTVVAAALANYAGGFVAGVAVIMAQLGMLVGSWPLLTKGDISKEV